MVLLAEKMPHVRSAALNFLVPAGCVYDPPEQPRHRLGAGRPDHPRRRRARQPGADPGPGQPRPGPRRERRPACTCASGARRWPATCPRPWRSTPTSSAGRTCPTRSWTPSRRWPCRTCKAWRTSRGRRCWSSCASGTTRRRWANDRRGTAEGIESIDRRRRPPALSPAVSAAGHDPVGGRQHRLAAAAATRSNGCSATGKAATEPPVQLTKPAAGKRDHLQKDTTQTQIAIAYPSVPFGHADYYAAQGAVQRALRRHERPAVHRGPREARPVLLRLGQLPDVQGPRQHPLLRRHHQRTRPGDARRDAGRAEPAARTASRTRRSTASRPG